MQRGTSSTSIYGSLATLQLFVALPQEKNMHSKLQTRAALPRLNPKARAIPRRQIARSRFKCADIGGDSNSKDNDDQSEAFPRHHTCTV